MLIACKCLNITLKSATNFDDAVFNRQMSQANRLYDQSENTAGDNNEEHAPFIPNSILEKLISDRMQFFKTVSSI